MNIIAALVATLLPLALLDAAWLSVMGKSFYAARLQNLMGDSFKIAPVLLFYPLYAIGLYVFVVAPSLFTGRPLLPVFLLGALFGLVAYAAYDLTNQATLRDWQTIVTVVDMAWGAFLSGAASSIAVATLRYFS